MSSELPIHFFTIVLNGEPFIRYHLDVFNQLPFRWHWHIVEGVAELKHDTAWSVQYGGRISDELHRQGRSNDGTSEYLDELVRGHPERITLYRKPEQVFWDGKLEMVNAPLPQIQEACLLWQVDVDELWTPEQIIQTRTLFLENPEKNAAFFRCCYFVGERLVISNRDCFTQYPKSWLRVWKFAPGAIWSTHEPPTLVWPTSEAAGIERAVQLNPFLETDTEALNLVFQHLAYVIPSQLQFKEHYYGYHKVTEQWQTLQAHTRFPVLLRQFFPWVTDCALVDTVETCGVIPIAQQQSDGTWHFRQPTPLSSIPNPPKPAITVAIDAVLFQLYQSGMAEVWRFLIETWAMGEFAQHLLILDREASAPTIPGIRYRLLPGYGSLDLESDRQLLQDICEEEGVEAFISTYNTAPLSTPSVVMVHDLTPETEGWFIKAKPQLQEKHRCIARAATYVAIPEAIAHNLVKFFPLIPPDAITVARCGVPDPFVPANAEAIQQFKATYGITKPYFLLKAGNHNYSSDHQLFFYAFAQLCSRQGFEILYANSDEPLTSELRVYTAGSVVHCLQLDSEDLRIAYSGAVAFIHTSQRDGLALSVLEAMACDCPVITCPNASIAEVAADAVLYVDEDNVDAMAIALCDIQKPEVRRTLIQKGRRQSQQFPIRTMATTIQSILIAVTLLHLNLRDINWIAFPDWQQAEPIRFQDLQAIVRTAMTYPERSRMTLLITTNGIDSEIANLAMSDALMHLVLEEGLEVEDAPEISLISQLSRLQWNALLPCLHARVPVAHEDWDAIAQAGAARLLTITEPAS